VIEPASRSSRPPWSVTIRSATSVFHRERAPGDVTEDPKRAANGLVECALARAFARQAREVEEHVIS